MSTRLSSAIVLGLAIIAGPMGGSVLAQNTPVVTQATLAATIRAAATAAAGKTHVVVRNGQNVTLSFAALSANEKAAVLKASVQEALSATPASPAAMAAALTAAANSGVIPAGLAVSIAADVAPALATQVAANTTPAATTSTASVTTQQTVSVLTSLQNTAAPAGGGEAPASTTTTVVVAPFDPCSGVVAAYCGS